MGGPTPGCSGVGNKVGRNGGDSEEEGSQDTHDGGQWDGGQWDDGTRGRPGFYIGEESRHG